MAESEADVAFGVILKKGGALIGDAYSDWGLELTSITPPGFARDQIDVTHHQSPEGWSEAIVSAIKKSKPFPAEFNWLPENTGDIITAMEDGMGWWKIEFPNSHGSVTFKAGVSDFSPGAMTPDGKMSGTCEFTPTGKPTWA